MPELFRFTWRLVLKPLIRFSFNFINFYKRAAGSKVYETGISTSAPFLSAET